MDLAFVIRDDPDEKITFEKPEYSTNLRLINNSNCHEFWIKSDCQTFNAFKIDPENVESCTEFHKNTPMPKADQTVYELADRHNSRSRESSGDSNDSLKREIKLKKEKLKKIRSISEESENNSHPISKKPKIKLKIDENIFQTTSAEPHKHQPSPISPSSTKLQKRSFIQSTNHHSLKLENKDKSPSNTRKISPLPSPDIQHNKLSPKLSSQNFYKREEENTKKQLQHQTSTENTSRACEFCNGEISDVWEWKRFCCHSCMFSYTEIYYDEFFDQLENNAEEVQVLN